MTIEFIKQLPSEVITVVVGVSGGIVGFLVSDGSGYRLFIASAFVGGFAAFVFPPLIIMIIESAGIKVVPEISRSITGTVSAVSWQLVLSLKGAVPLLVNKYTGQVNDGTETNKIDK
jgi:hypothetical protein